MGTIGFVFEGWPNVLVDAYGMLASGNTVVLRTGRDASAPAQAIADHALYAAMDEAGLPRAVALIPSLGHAAAWALFTDRRLALAIARGSGAAVRRFGDLASQSGCLSVCKAWEGHGLSPTCRHRRSGSHRSSTLEKFATSLPLSRLTEEWEWERTAEITLAIVDDLQHGIDLFNAYSPRFVASLIADDEAVQTCPKTRMALNGDIPLNCDTRPFGMIQGSGRGG